MNPYQNTPTAKLIPDRVRDLSHRKTQAEIASEAGFANANMMVSAGPSPMAYWLDYSAKFHGMSSSTSLCICWSRILRSVAAI